MSQTETEILVLAALLHGIGKFAQRAKRPQNADREGGSCPSYKEQTSHLYSLYTSYFIENDLPLPPELIPAKTQLARLASAHHKSAGDGLLELVLSQADRLSMGMDMPPQDEEAGASITSRLLSSFSQVSLSNNVVPPKRYYKLAAIDSSPFPESLEVAQDSNYEQLFSLFIAGLGRIDLGMGVKHYLASLSSLLEQYTWCIPSSACRTEPDISLYDHAMATAAIAQSLAAFHRHHGGQPSSKNINQPKFILIGGDLSGIQSYIFGIEKSHGAGVAKLLRARSFHLQALTHSVILDFLERAELLVSAKIMDAGGRFVLLLPAIPSVEELLPRFTNEVQAWFFETFKGHLSLNISNPVYLSEADFALSNFHKKLDELFDDLEVRKMAKFSSLLQAGRSPIAAPDGEDFSAGACSICRINPVSEAASAQFESQTSKSVKLCQQCENQISRIGRKLPQESTRFALFSHAATCDSTPLFGGISLHFTDAVTQKHKTALDIVNLHSRGQFTYRAIAGHLPRFTDNDSARWTGEGRKNDEQDTLAAGAAKTFSQLAEEARIPNGEGRLRGKAFLGAFKADVDNLGLIFNLGLGDKLSISRFSGLSRMLNHFFAEVMVGMIRNDPVFHDIYVVFAGGDDLFLIGPWHQLMHFAEKLAADFQRYVSNNSDITLSAGIFMSKPNLPANTIARNASALLDESKKYHRVGDNGKSKNAVTALGITTGWEDYPALLRQGQWLEKLVLDGSVPSGLVMRLMSYADDCEAFLAGRGGRRSGMYLSHMRYDFARNLANEALPAKDKEDLEALGTDPKSLSLMRLPISYALYKMRTE